MFVEESVGTCFLAAITLSQRESFSHLMEDPSRDEFATSLNSAARDSFNVEYSLNSSKYLVLLKVKSTPSAG